MIRLQLSTIWVLVITLLQQGTVQSFRAGTASSNSVGVSKIFPITRQSGPLSSQQRHTKLSALPPATPWVVAHVVAGAAGTPVVVGAIGKTKDGWYKRIPKPAWTPPDGTFAPIWTTLYALMGISVARIYQLWKATDVAATKTKAGYALICWGVHIFGNLIWAPVFFGWKRLRLGCQINVALWASLTAIIPLFYKLEPVTAYLLVPYWFWLVFATALNNSICKLNPTDANGFNVARFQDELVKLQKKAAEYADSF